MGAGANGRHALPLRDGSPLPLCEEQPVPPKPPLLKRCLKGVRVVIFGDSWAEDNSRVEHGLFAGVTGWPKQLADILGLPVAGNFAKGQSETRSLMKQLERAVKELGPKPDWENLLVILHTGGNDFIGAEKNYNPFAKHNFWIKHCTWGFQKKKREVIQNIWEFIGTIHDLGCCRFLVSHLPFTSKVPALRLAKVVCVDTNGHKINSQLDEMLTCFSEKRRAKLDMACVPEAENLNTIVSSCPERRKARTKRLFLRDRFHPSQELHRQLAEAVAARIQNSSVTTALD